MARAALGLSVDDLARESGVPGPAITDLEAGKTGKGDVVSALNIYFATHGIELIDDDGVRARTAAAGGFIPVDQLTTANDGGVS
ncbi:helix-turn-helix domain-containing protein [Lichenifustis flavocetrariae]|uniref:Helix-turn-helix transcriptional regulator n=1 Tax=Lichenifustis flavocetrariae TaxID=2949735 RepID=A0AA41YWX3_9HYPH|nr:helix-turn-helix transcriptional regulator [Lichenifustis flavocetrariae]MCW6509624.1 helix-turn-helix transcriptional regulator [Lichenifustis flavocetrariae]